MLSKSILKYIQSLHHKKYRDEHNVFIAEGTKTVHDLFLSGQFKCKMICAVDSFYNEHEALLSHVDTNDKFIITEIDLQKISLLHTPNKVAAVFYQKESKDVSLENALSLMLDEIKDPGNMGSILRIADWFGIKNIVCSNDCADVYNPKVIQASMGSIARVNVTYTDLENFIIDNKQINVYAATLAGTPLYTFKKITEGLVLIGNESKGVKTDLLRLVSGQITIPRFGGAESLNAAVATGIIISHLANINSK